MTTGRCFLMETIALQSNTLQNFRFSFSLQAGKWMLQIHLCPLTDRKKKQVLLNSRTFNLILCSSTKNIHQFKRTKSFIFSKLNLFKDKKRETLLYNVQYCQCTVLPRINILVPVWWKQMHIGWRDKWS